VITLPQEELEEITCMIHYFYHLDYEELEAKTTADLHGSLTEPPQDSLPSPESVSLVVNAKIYALAEKYLVPGLKALTARKFDIASAKLWDSDDFIEAVQEVYTSTIETDRGLRSIVLRTFHDHQQLIEKSEVQGLVKQFGSLASDIVIHVWNKSK
jgi:hypothetical protein